MGRCSRGKSRSSLDATVRRLPTPTSGPLSVPTNTACCRAKRSTAATDSLAKCYEHVPGSPWMFCCCRRVLNPPGDSGMAAVRIASPPLADNRNGPGTFRKPPFLVRGKFPWLDDIPDWSSVLPVVVPDGHPVVANGPGLVVPRLKKYPAVACTEVFRPTTVALRPTIPARPESLASKVTELICSEVFLASSPSNLLGLAWAFAEYLGRFGAGELDQHSRYARAQVAVTVGHSWICQRNFDGASTPFPTDDSICARNDVPISRLRRLGAGMLPCMRPHDHIL